MLSLLLFWVKRGWWYINFYLHLATFLNPYMLSCLMKLFRLACRKYFGTTMFWKVMGSIS